MLVYFYLSSAGSSTTVTAFYSTTNIIRKHFGRAQRCVRGLFRLFGAGWKFLTSPATGNSARTDAESYRRNIFCTAWRASRRRQRLYMLEKIANYFDCFPMLLPVASRRRMVCVSRWKFCIYVPYTTVGICRVLSYALEESFLSNFIDARFQDSKGRYWILYRKNPAYFSLIYFTWQVYCV